MLHQPGKNDWSCIRNAYVMQPIKRYSSMSLDELGSFPDFSDKWLYPVVRLP